MRVNGPLHSSVRPVKTGFLKRARNEMDDKKQHCEYIPRYAMMRQGSHASAQVVHWKSFDLSVQGSCKNIIKNEDTT